MLSAKNIESYYGPIAAIKGLTMEIQESKITVILGANGAGKQRPQNYQRRDRTAKRENKL